MTNQFYNKHKNINCQAKDFKILLIVMLLKQPKYFDSKVKYINYITLNGLSMTLAFTHYYNYSTPQIFSTIIQLLT